MPKKGVKAGLSLPEILKKKMYSAVLGVPHLLAVMSQ